MKLSDNELEEGLRDLLRVFTPSPRWSSDSPWSSPSRSVLVFLLSACYHGQLRRWDEAAKRTPYVETRDWYQDEAASRLHWVVMRRRGRGDSLRNQTWSAYKHLQRMHPRSKLEPHWDGLPYCYVHAKSGTVVTAGNIEPDRMLRFLVNHQLTRLGIIGLDWKLHPHYPDELIADERDGYKMNWLEFTPQGFEALAGHFRDRELAIWGLR